MIHWLLSKFIDPSLLEEFFGDLEELHADRSQSRGKFYANMMNWVDALHLLIGFSRTKAFRIRNGNIMMIGSMVKIAWRSAIRQKQTTLLNILGLTIGIAVCLTIGLFVYDELTYDTFHSKGDRIYRINQSDIWDNWDAQSSTTGPNVAVALRTDIPEFEQVTRLLSMGSQTIIKSEGPKKNAFKEDYQFAAEENFFDVFTFEFYDGDPETALDKPMSMVLTYETAIRYFGYENALGKTLQVKGWDGTWQTFTVTGVLANIPAKSHIQFDMLVSLNSYQENMDRDGWKWIWTAFSTYGMVHEGTDIAALTAKLQELPPKWAPPTTERIFNQTYEEFTAGNPWKLILQPIQNIYNSKDPGFNVFGPIGNPLFVKIFAVVGILVLILSCINFMNLSTAQSTMRAKEVGIRKVLGSNRKVLIYQFIFESVLFVTISTIAAFFLVDMSLSWFNLISSKHLELFHHLGNPQFWILILSFVLGLGVVTGSYPAFYMSAFKPIEILKGKIGAGIRSKGIRNTLVVAQFSISIALIICTFFVHRQLTYTTNLDLGFDKSNILQIHNIEQLGFDTESLRNKLSKNPAYTRIGKSFGVPPNIGSGDRYKAASPESDVVFLSNLRTEGSYVDLLDLKFIAGRNFEVSRASDKYSVILNEEAVKILGWGTKDRYSTDSPIGKSVALASGNEDELEVIGVVEDFNFSSVKQNIAPLIIIHHENDKVWDYGAGLSYYSLRLNPEAIKNASDLQLLIESTKRTLADIDSSIPFEYSFMDQGFENSFRSERKLSTVLNIFSILAVIIACLGLFGLSAYSAEQRIKELGIRKVLGAKVSQIVILFSSEFTKLILISILIASPVAYFLVDYWLEDFAYRTPIDLWVFALAIFGAFGIALFTISYQSVRAANRNPVDILKDE